MLNINRHNYEEFFLLYVDGELSAAEKEAVEAFVQENTDLAPELEMLQQTLLFKDERLVFENKSSLYKAENQGVNTTNHEEYFLNYIDQELTREESKAVETFVLQHPGLQESFSLLKQTKLQPETIVFPDKSSLYRKEEQEKPVIVMRWWKIAAAAVVIGLVGITLWTIQTNDNDSAPPIAVTNPELTRPAQMEPISVPRTEKNNVAAAVPATVQQSSRIENVIKAASTNNTNQDAPVTSTITDAIADNKTEIASAGPIRLNKEEPIATASNSTTEAPGAINKTTIKATMLSADIKSLLPPAEESDTKTLASHVSYKELDTDDEDKTLYIGSLEINKDKLRGFFRKASNIFRGKSARQEEEKNEDNPPGNTRTLK